MMRAIIVTYLTAVVLAGPSLCCCTMVRAVAMMAPKPATTAHAHTGGCRCSHSAAGKGRLAPDKSAPMPCDDRPCSAKEHQSLPFTVEPASQLMAKVFDGVWHQLLLASSDSPSAVEAVAATPAIPRENSGFPHLDGKGILRALHVWRC